MHDKQLTALLIEDNPGDARLIQESIRDAGAVRMTMTHRGTLAEATALLRSEEPDVVLLDLGLPDATGLDGLNRITHEFPKLPILVMSGNDDEELALQAIQAGAQDYLVKGRFDGRAMMRAIRYVFGRKRTLSQQAELLGAFAEELRKPVDALKQAIDTLTRMVGSGRFRAGLEPLARADVHVRLLQSMRHTMVAMVSTASGSLPAELQRLSAPQLIAEINRRARSGEDQTRSASITSKQRIDLLLVEDNPGDARLVRESLSDARDLEANVVHSISVTEAMARLQTQRFDVAIVDLGLPDAIGLEAVADIHRAAPALPIVVMTGTDDDRVALGALERGAQDYLIKGDSDPDSLARTLRYAMERQRAVNLCTDLMEGLASEMRSPLHVIIGNLCLAGAAASDLRDEPKVTTLKAAFEAASAVHHLSDDAIALARSGKMRDLETGATAGIDELRLGSTRRSSLAATAAGDLLRSAGRLETNPTPAQPESSGLLGRFVRRALPKKKNVLLFDRDDDCRAVTAAFLRSAGFEVVEASSAGDSWSKMQDTTFDLAVLDISAPGCTELRSQSRSAGVPLIAVHDGRTTDNLGGPTRQEALLAKPFAPDQLLFATEHLLRRS